MDESPELVWKVKKQDRVKKRDRSDGNQPQVQIRPVYSKHRSSLGHVNSIKSFMAVCRLNPLLLRLEGEIVTRLGRNDCGIPI